MNKFDKYSTFQVTLEDIYGRMMETVIYTYSKSLFHLLTGIASQSKKRLLKDIKGLKRRTRYEVDEVLWITSEKNPVHGLTKKGVFIAPEESMEVVEVRVDPQAWVNKNKRVQRAQELYQTFKTPQCRNTARIANEMT